MNTAAMTQLVELIDSESSQLCNVMADRDPEAWSKPSTCQGWTVGDVLAHLTQGAYTWRDTITRAIVGDADPPPGQRFLRPGERGSEITAHRAISFRQETGETALLDAFTKGYQELRQVLLRLQPDDLEKPCFHRRGLMPIRDYAERRLQELVIHGWDIRVAFDVSATVSEKPLAVMLGLVQRWLSNTFSPAHGLSTPVRYRFDVHGPLPLRQDVWVRPDGFDVEPVTSHGADVTFRCTTGDYILLIYGRLNLDNAVDIGRLEIEGSREQASLFKELFQGI